MRILEDDFKRLMIAASGLGASLIFFSLYLRDVERDSLFLSHGQPIGFIEKYEFDVTRRPRSRLLWIPVLAAGQVFEKDTIRTGHDSSVVINLGTQGRVELRPDSLAVLETQGDSFRINLASGDLFLKGDLVAKIGDTEIKSKGAAFGVSRDSISGQFRVQSQSGHLELSKNGQVSDLKEGSQFTESQDGQSQTIQIPVARLTPIDGSEIKIPKVGAPITFRLGWVKDSAATQYQDLKKVRVEFSKDRLFQSVIAAVDIGTDTLSSSTNQSAQLNSDGSFFWRVTNPDSKNALSSTGRFSIKSPSLWTWTEKTQPGETPTFLAELTDTGFSLDLDWVGPKDAHSHELKFMVKDMLVTQTQSGPRHRVRLSKANDPWVQALKNLNEQQLSDLRIELTAFDAGQKSLVEAPLVASLMLSDARGLPALLNLSSAIQKDPRSTKLTWTLPVGEGFETELTLGQKILPLSKNEIVLDTQKVLQSYEQGQLKVRLKAQDGRVGKWQEWSLVMQKFKDAVSVNAPVTLLTPSADKTIPLQRKDPIEFRWASVGSSRLAPVAYRLTIKAGQKVFASREVSQTRVSIEGPAEGSYAWTVQALWPEGVEGPPSEERRFDIVRKTLRAPSIRVPATVK